MEWATICAILLSPLIAVQVTQWLNDKKATKERKLGVFKTLMETRATGLTPKHVEALNKIDVEFYGNDDKSRKVIEAWKIYHDHLHETGSEKLEGEKLQTWTEKGRDLLADLLYEMAHALGYQFDKVIIKRGHYYPRGFGDLETDQYILRKSLIDLLTYKRPLPVIIVPPPEPPKSIYEQATDLFKSIE